MTEVFLSRMTVVRLSAAAFAIGTAWPAMAQDDDGFKVGMAVGGNPCCEWMKAQGDVARALAEERGWDYMELSNNNDPAQAVQNAQVFVQEGVDVMIQFNGQPSSNPAIAQIMATAGIPVITYDIAQEGMYFVGIDNQAAGIAGGEALGELIKAEWDCNPDLVISAEGAVAGIVNEWRTGGMREGLANVCPDIPEEKYVSFESQGDAAVGLPAARDLLAANPEAERMAVVGLNDGGVLAALQAAEQLGRADQIIGWGQDGAFITGDNVNPNLAGSVFYFLEGYAVYAFQEVIDPIAEGNPPPLKDQPGDPAASVEPCPVSAKEAANVPGTGERVDILLESEPGMTAVDLFCPN